MLLKEEIEKKWAAVLDCADLPKITDPWRRAQTGLMLEQNAKAIREEAQLLNEALPVNFAGTGGYATAAAAGGPVAGYDPILISLVRRAAPKFMAYDVAGVQAMSGPTGLIFAMRSMYANATGVITPGANVNVEEAFYNEANTAFSGNGTHTPFDTANVNPATGNTSYFNLGANTGYGYPNLVGEDLGGATAFKKMGFSIEKVTVTANTRGLDAGYTLELAQDLKAVHGLDAETELANILSTEILAEINREVIRTIYITAKVGAQTSNSAGVFNLTDSADTDGRWAVEKYKSLIFLIERECNKIYKDTRRGKGNILIVSSDVGSALAISGLLDYDSGLKAGVDGLSDNASGAESTFLGTLAGRVKVYVDPYSVSGADYVVAGYRGASVYDAGLFYCPYVSLQMVRAIDPNTYQPKIGFKTRYGLVANPFAEGTSQGLGRLAANTNQWYRKFIVRNLK